MLRQIELTDRDGVERPLRRDFKRNRPRRGGALINGEDETVHEARFFQISI